ncbi:MAG: hypothetical protein ABI883_07950, partial [Chthoniobacterales bacterium]
MLPLPSGRSWLWTACATLLALGLLIFGARAADPTSSPASAAAKLKNAIAPGGIPLPIGQEAKGLVLPDYNPQGQLQAKFEAATAKRVNAEEVEFKGLKMTTFTPENTTDLVVEMPSSVLNLETRVISSRDRTTIARADFRIAGDKVTFDTVARQGTLVGNVKMVITGKGQLIGKPGQ